MDEATALTASAADVTRCVRRVRVGQREGLFDIRVAAGRIASVDPHDHARRPAGDVVDADGLLAIPAFVDGHVHLDKTFFGGPWVPHRGSDDVPTRIATEKQLRREHRRSLGERARRLATTMSAFGTTALRTHVDIDEETRLGGFEVLAALRDELADRLDMQIVAFPQSGLWAAPSVVADMTAALGLGADAVGAVDPTLVDRDAVRSLDTVFGLADRFGVAVDIHLHEPGETGAAVILGMCERAAALGLEGRVTVSHGFCLADLAPDRLAEVATEMAEAGVALMTSAPGPGPLVPVHDLARLGVTVFAGSDNVRDAWAPFGNGDMLDRARMLAVRADLRTDEGLAFALACTTTSGAGALGFEPRGLAVGDRADFVLVASGSVPEAVCEVPAQRRVFRSGREIVRDEERAVS